MDVNQKVTVHRDENGRFKHFVFHKSEQMDERRKAKANAIKEKKKAKAQRERAKAKSVPKKRRTYSNRGVSQYNAKGENTREYQRLERMLKKATDWREQQGIIEEMQEIQTAYDHTKNKEMAEMIADLEDWGATDYGQFKRNRNWRRNEYMVRTEWYRFKNERR